MKYLRKFLENTEYNKEKMLKEFQEVFGFPLYSLIDRLLEWEDKGLDFVVEAGVWIKSKSNKKYNLQHTMNPFLQYPDVNSGISSYVNQLFRYRTGAETDDNLEILYFQPIDIDDIIAASLCIHECFPNEMYLHDPNYREREKYYEEEFEKLIDMIKRRFPLIEIEGKREELMSGTTRGVLFKRKVD